jgi:hypothetical protein
MFPRGYPDATVGQDQERCARVSRAGEGFCVGSSRGRVRTALVGAIATDVWQQVHEAVVGDHHGRAAGRATLLVTLMDEILGTHSTA